MKKLFFFFVLSALSFTVSAQEIAQQQLKFGYFSMNEVIKTMPDYAIAQKNLSDLERKYEAETKRSEDEFNKKYEEFLDGQRDFAPSISQKRQAELQNMMDKNVAFKKESKRLLHQARTEAFAPLKAKLAAVLQRIGAERGYAFILNTDNDNVPYINSTKGEDVSALVKVALNK